MRTTLGRAVARLYTSLAAVTVASSHIVARALARPRRTVVVYPSIEPSVAEGDPEAFGSDTACSTWSPAATLADRRGRGQDIAIRAFAELRRDHAGAYLVIAGNRTSPADRAFVAELERLASYLGVPDAVHLCGSA